MKSALVPLLWGTVSVLIGWPFVEFVARPFRQFFDIRRQVARALVNYGNVGARSVRTQTGEWKTIDLHPEDDAQLVKAQEAYRGLAADMRAFANGEHLAYWAVKGFRYDANIIASALISLEVNLPVKGEDLHQSRNAWSNCSEYDLRNDPSRHIGGLHQPAQRQLRHVCNIGVGEASAHFQHRADTFQKNTPALDRHSVRSGHDDFQLRISQTNHARHDGATAPREQNRFRSKANTRKIERPPRGGLSEIAQLLYLGGKITFRFLRHPRSPTAPPVAKSGSAAGSGTAAGFTLTSSRNIKPGSSRKLMPKAVFASEAVTKKVNSLKGASRKVGQAGQRDSTECDAKSAWRPAIRQHEKINAV